MDFSTAVNTTSIQEDLGVLAVSYITFKVGKLDLLPKMLISEQLSIV